MTPRLAIALLRRGGSSLLAAAALAWWALHLDGVTRAERQGSEAMFRTERVEDRRIFAEALRRLAEECLREKNARATVRARELGE